MDEAAVASPTRVAEGTAAALAEPGPARDSTLPGLAGRVALVTGGGRGIGRAIALAFARYGADVAVAARTQAEVEAVAEEVRALGRRALALEADVSREGAAAYIVHQTLAGLGRLDILVNNAGAFHRALVADLEVEDWDRVIGTNLRGPYLVTRAALPTMLERNAGTIVFMGSTSSKRGDAGSSAYCASKFALAGFAQSLLYEVRRFGIRVILISPSSVDTRSGPGAPPSGPGARLTAEDVAETVVAACLLPERALVREIELWNTSP